MAIGHCALAAGPRCLMLAATRREATAKAKWAAPCDRCGMGAVQTTHVDLNAKRQLVVEASGSLENTRTQRG